MYETFPFLPLNIPVYIQSFIHSFIQSIVILILLHFYLPFVEIMIIWKITYIKEKKKQNKINNFIYSHNRFETRVGKQTNLQ